MAGAAVAIIVASRFSMNSAAATSNATGRRNPAREACGSLPSTTIRLVEPPRDDDRVGGPWGSLVIVPGG